MPKEATPLVSCVMPTCNRPGFVPQAIRYFQLQDYPQKELIILDDGDEGIGDSWSDDPRIRYVRMNERCVLGTKRNLACEEARGEIIVHWDDDDWIAAWRISYQVEHLRRTQAEVCGIDRLFYYDPQNERAWQYVYDAAIGKPWVAGGTICYTRAAWMAHPFSAVNSGEDNDFVWATPAGGLLVLPDTSFYVGIIHPGNVSRKQTNHRHNWQPQSTETVRTLIGKDQAFYDSIGQMRR